MNTPAHLIIGAAIYARPGAFAVNLAAIAGALLPDVSLYFMFFWNKFVRGMTEAQIFGVEYFSDYWQQVFAIDNSLILWGGCFVVALLVRLPALIAFAGAGTIHLVLDFLLHHDDGRAHFWPFSDWKFQSPVSYWDPAHFGLIMGPLEGLICLALLIMLWRRFIGSIARVLIVLVGLLECVPAIVFPIFFSFG